MLKKLKAEAKKILEENKVKTRGKKVYINGVRVGK